VPIYVKNYDRKTLLAAIAFYASPQGHALVEKLPIVTSESMEAGKMWGQELARKTLREMGIPAPAKMQ
jgi:hypothetical protein